MFSCSATGSCEHGSEGGVGRRALTLWAVAGLGVTALHSGGSGVGAALVHMVQVPVLVRADHLALTRAGAAAHGALWTESLNSERSC